MPTRVPPSPLPRALVRVVFAAVTCAASACSSSAHDDESLESIAARTSVLMPVNADSSGWKRAGAEDTVMGER